MKDMRTQLARLVRRFLREESGANGAEYAMLAGLIAIAFVAGAGTLGTTLNSFLGNVATCVTSPSAVNCAVPFGG